MATLGEIIKGVTKLVDEGYIFKEEDKSSLAKLANNLEFAERKVLVGVLKDLGIDLEEIDKANLLKNWNVIARGFEGEYDEVVIEVLEGIYDLENPIEDYPFSLEEDTTVAGMLYKGDRRYDALLSHFSPEIAANVYLVHYEHKLKSIKAFYTLMNIFKEEVTMPCRVLFCIFMKMSNQRMFGFLTRMKSNALNVLGEDKCSKLGTIIFKSLVGSFNVSRCIPLYGNEMLHLIYILGIDQEELREMHLSGFIKYILRYYEISKPLYMKYRGLREFNLSSEELRRLSLDEYPMYPSIVGEEGERLYREFYEYAHQIRSEV